LVANRQLSGQALDWITCALDPFHDLQISPQGFPDMASSKSVVQTITKTLNVPGGTVPWDMHCFFLPLSTVRSVSGLNTNRLYRTTVTAAGVIAGNQTPRGLNPGLNVIRTTSGVPWSDNTSLPFNSLALDPEFTSGQYRFIGVGWEIVDTSPVISRQGSITAYRMPSVKQNTYVVDALALTLSAESIALPPVTQTQSALYPNSRTWAAPEGIYQVASMNSIENPYVNSVAGLPIARFVQDETSLNAGTPILAYMPALDDTIDGNTTVIPPIIADLTSCSHAFPWDISGCVLSQLNPAGSFQVTVRYFIERIPTTSDNSLLVMAKNPTPYDPLALEIYARATQELPIGVPVSENPLGEWFEKILDIIGGALPAIGSALAPVIPFAPALATGLASGAFAVSEWNRNARTQTTPQLPQQMTNTGANAVVLTPNGNRTGQVKNQGKPRKPLPKSPRVPGYKPKR
jgi:hypothetical protein